MLKMLTITLLIVFSMITITAQERPVIQDDAAQAAWIEDIDFYMDRVLSRHPDPYFRLSESDFRQAAESLKADVPYLTDNQIIIGLMRLTANLDGHTFLFPLSDPPGFHLYPLRLYWFEEGMYVVNALDESLIGMRLVEINGVGVEKIAEDVDDIVPHDNPYQLRGWTPLFMMMPEVLQALGFIDDQPNFVLENAAGELITLNPEPVTFDDYLTWNPEIPVVSLPQQPEPLHLSNKDENFWMIYLEDSNSLYIQYNGVQYSSQSRLTITALGRDIKDFLAENDVDRVILDMRYCIGGEMETYIPFLRALEDLQIDPLYVIIGRQTFSAGVHFLLDLKEVANFTLVGEPSGGAPHFGSARSVILPNSKIEVLVSTQQYPREGSAEDDIWLIPDVFVPPTAADYFSGRDAALEAILEG